MKYHAFRVAGKLFSILPWWAGYPLGRLLARVAFTVRVPARAAVEANMRVVLGAEASQAAVERAAKAVFANLGRYYVDLFRTPGTDLEDLNRRYIIETGYEEYVAPTLRAGQGVVVLSGHLGTPELAVQALKVRGPAFIALVEPLKPPALFAYVQGLRSSHGNRFVAADARGVKQAFRVLKACGIVIILGDRDIQGAGRLVPLFGRPARLPTGAFELAQRAGAALVPGFARRIDDRRWRIRLLPPLVLQATGNHDEDLDANLRKYAALLEEAVREEPGQWLVLSRVWDAGTGPDGYTGVVPQRAD